MGRFVWKKEQNWIRDHHSPQISHHHLIGRKREKEKRWKERGGEERGGQGTGGERRGRGDSSWTPQL